MGWGAGAAAILQSHSWSKDTIEAFNSWFHRPAARIQSRLAVCVPCFLLYVEVSQFLRVEKFLFWFCILCFRSAACIRISIINSINRSRTCSTMRPWISMIKSVNRPIYLVTGICRGMWTGWVRWSRIISWLCRNMVVQMDYRLIGLISKAVRRKDSGSIYAGWTSQ